MPKTKLTKGRMNVFVSWSNFENQFTNLSCKLEIFDEILFSPVKLMNRLENTFLHTRETITGEVSFSALYTFFLAQHTQDLYNTELHHLLSLDLFGGE